MYLFITCFNSIWIRKRAKNTEREDEKRWDFFYISFFFNDEIDKEESCITFVKWSVRLEVNTTFDHCHYKTATLPFMQASSFFTKNYSLYLTVLFHVFLTPQLFITLFKDKLLVIICFFHLHCLFACVHISALELCTFFWRSCFHKCYESRY